MEDNIKLPPLHYDELPESDDLIPAMHNYARKAIKADRQRRGEPVAWAYELARPLTPDGEYGDWEARISFAKPNVPAKSIRNLSELYASPTQPTTAAPDLLEALDNLLSWAEDIHDPRKTTRINYHGLDMVRTAIAKALGKEK